MQGFIGIVVILLLAWACSEARREVRLAPIGITLAAQFVLSFLFLQIPILSQTIGLLRHIVTAIQTASLEGTKFIFGFLGGDTIPFEQINPNENLVLFAFQIIPQIVVFSALVALLWHWKVLPLFVRGFAVVLQKALRTGGAVGLAAAASLFLGMVESPMVIRAYLMKLSRSEFFTVITCGISTVAGSIMILYAQILGPVLDDAIKHILTASVINIFGAIMIARIMVPGETITEAEGDLGSIKYEGFADALTRGTADGVNIAVNVCAMLVVLISLVALVNYILAAIPVGEQVISLQLVMGWICAPLAWSMGVPWVDASAAGSLIATKFVLNELIAFGWLSEMSGDLQTSTKIIMTYTICGFTNLGSVGILIGGVSALVPERRSELLVLAPRTLISGTLVACLTGTIVGLVSLLNF